MPQHPAQRAGIPLSPNAYKAEHDHTDPAWKAWQARVDHGLIGAWAGLTFDNRVRMMRNEVAIFGRVVTRELEQF